MKEQTVYVYADWVENAPVLVGRLFISATRGKETFSFAYDKKWLKREESNFVLDPELQLHPERQYVPADKPIFGMFSDSCPDRWGKLLMQRREAINARKEDRRPRALNESDFLLGVYDESRMGALRFSYEESGPFLSHDKDMATPPWVKLRTLENAVSSFESATVKDEEKWLNMLIAPGSSLGGARPKASVIAPDGSIWIAKFPKKDDEANIGAWEMVAHDLAKMCKLNLPEARVEKFSKTGSTFLVKRFDRENGKRIHFASAMTLLGKVDGDHSAGYLDIASFISQNGCNPSEDLKELWRRIVFSVSISNIDDHLRNHGFLLTPAGWKLSPAYDINPTIYGDHLSLCVSPNDASLNYDNALQAAKYFGISDKDAKQYIEETKAVVRNNWKKLAADYGISRSEIERYEPAFMATRENSLDALMDSANAQRSVPGPKRTNAFIKNEKER